MGQTSLLQQARQLLVDDEQRAPQSTSLLSKARALLDEEPDGAQESLAARARALLGEADAGTVAAPVAPTRRQRAREARDIAEAAGITGELDPTWMPDYRGPGARFSGPVPGFGLPVTPPPGPSIQDIQDAKIARSEAESRGLSAAGSPRTSVTPDDSRRRPSLAPMRPVASHAAGGVLEQGNIDLFNRPKVANPAGGTSTVFSSSFNIDGKEVLLPLADEGRIFTEEEAIEKYRRTGQHLGIFDSPQAASAYAEQLHADYEGGKYEPMRPVASHDRALPVQPPVGFGDAMSRGVDVAQGMGYGAVEAAGEALGIDALASFGGEGRRANAADVAAAGPRAALLDVDGLSSFGQWVKETIGEQIPIMAPSMAGGLAGAAMGSAVPGIGTTLGALIGAFAPTFLMGVGEVQGAIKERGEDQSSPTAAFVGGSAIAALDSVLPGKIGSRLVTSFGRQAAEHVATRVLAHQVAPTFLRRTATGAVAGMATEGLTEAFQEAIGEFAAAKGTGTPVDPALGSQMLEAGGAGALLGGLLGGASSVRSNVRPAPALPPMAPAVSHARGLPVTPIAPVASHDVGATPPPTIEHLIAPPVRQTLSQQVAQDTVDRNAAARGTPEDVPANPVAQQLEAERQAAAAQPLDMEALLKEADQIIATPVREPGAEPTTEGAPAVSTQAKAGEFYTLRPEDIQVDPARFQFKAGTNDQGVTSTAKIEGPWNEARAGVLMVWKDPADGKTYVVNGHHRLEAAKRLGAERVAVRYVDAPDATTARVEGALTNISEDKGTPLDAAKLIRDGGYAEADLVAAGLSPRSALVRDAMGLARLSDPLFDRVVTGDVSESLGGAIGSADLSPEGQAAVAKLVDRQQAKGRNLTPAQVRALAQDVASTPEVKAGSADGQTDIFGLLGEERTQNVAVEKAVLRDWARQQLEKDKRLFGYVAKEDRAEALARAGNTIDVQASKAIADEAGKVSAVFDRLAGATGPVSSALNAAAVRIAEGSDTHETRQDLLAALRAAVASELGVPAPQADSGGKGPDRQERPGPHPERRPADPQPVQPERVGSAAPSQPASEDIGAKQHAGFDTAGDALKTLQQQYPDRRLRVRSVRVSGGPPRAVVEVHSQPGGWRLATREALGTAVTGEQDRDLPGAEAVRDVEYPTPPVADLPFTLSRETARREEQQPSLGLPIDPPPVKTPKSAEPAIASRPGVRRGVLARTGEAVYVIPREDGTGHRVYDAQGRYAEDMTDRMLADATLGVRFETAERTEQQPSLGLPVTPAASRKAEAAPSPLPVDPPKKPGGKAERGLPVRPKAPSRSGGSHASMASDAAAPAFPVKRGSLPVRPRSLIDEAGTPPHPSGTGAIAFPELVTLARELIGTPQVVKRFRSAGKLGEFSNRRGIRLRADLFKPENAQDLAATLAHEIGHLADWLPDKTLKRGNLLGRLRSLQSFLQGHFSSADGITITNRDVREELLALSMKWRPWDPKTATASFAAYRRSGVELYADAISVLLNNPGMLEAEAPIFYREFFHALDGKPDVQQTYMALQELLSGTPEELIARRLARDREMFAVGDTAAMDLERLRQREVSVSAADAYLRLRIQHVDKNTAVRDKSIELERRGVWLNPDTDPRYLLEEQNYLGSVQEAFIKGEIQPIHQALDTAGVTWPDFGQVLFYDRIIAGDRSEVANPNGLAPQDATALREAHLAAFTPEQRAVLAQQATAFRRALMEVQRQGYEAGLYTDTMWDQMRENPAYVTFRVIEHFDHDVTARANQQVGTLKWIQNPADATILKMLATIRAIELQKLKVATWEMLSTHFPESIEQAEHRWNGRAIVPVEPADPKTQVLIRYYEKGKLRGKYVSPYIAESFQNNSIGYNNAIVAAVRWVNGNLFRPVFVQYNPGFQTFNFWRDFWGFWKKMPGMTVGRTLRRYVEAMPVARARAFGLGPRPNAARRARYAQVLEAQKAKILGPTYNDLLSGHDVADTQIEELFAKSGLKGYGGDPRAKILPQAVRDLLTWVKKAGDFVETLPKAAAIIEFKGKGSISQIPADQRSHIRRKVGMPDPLMRGTWTPVTNEFLLFSNIITQGWRADLEVATDPKTRADFWWKTAAASIVPKLAMAALLFAVFGGEDDDDDESPDMARLRKLQHAYRGISEYDRTNYFPVPIGTDAQGHTVYVRLPQDESGRFFGGLTWKMIQLARGDKDTLSTLAQVFDYTAGQFPGLTPTFGIVGDIAAVSSGRNVFDPFRTRFLFTDDELKARDWRTVKKFLGYEFQQLGGGIVWKFFPGDTRPRAQSTGQKILDMPVVSNVVGRWIKISDFGAVEQLRAAQAATQRVEARARLDERAQVNAALRSYQQGTPVDQTPAALLKAAQTIVNDLYADRTDDERNEKGVAIYRKLRMGVVKGTADPVVDTVLSATSNAQKVSIILKASEQMTTGEFEAWLTKAAAEGVVSQNVIDAVIAAWQRKHAPAQPQRNALPVTPR